MKNLKNAKKLCLLIVSIMILQLAMPFNFAGAEPMSGEEQGSEDVGEYGEATSGAAIKAGEIFSTGKDLDNIFKNPKVTVNDAPLVDGSVIEIKDGMIVKIHYDWELPDDDGTFKLNENDFAVTKLPEVLKAINPEAVGKLLDGEGKEVGSYTFEDGNLKVVFNDSLVGKNDRAGNVWFMAEFKLEEFEESVIQEIEFEKPFEPITIKVNPKTKLGILNKRVSLNADINATEIYWEIDVNTSLDSLTSRIIFWGYKSCIIINF